MPTAVNMVTVRAEIRDPVTSLPAQGVVRFHLPYALRDATDHILFGNIRPIVAALVDGIAVFEAPANDSAGVSPQGFAYTIEIDTDVMASTFFALLPSSPNDVHLSDLVPVLIPPPVGVPGGGIVSISSPDSSITVGGNSTAKTVVVAAGVQSAITAAANAAAAAQSTATAAGSAAASAQTTASAAYVKPGGGVPRTDLAAAVQTSLGKADTALQSVPAAADPAAARFGGHSCNIPLYVCKDISTINGEAWVAIVPVKAGVPIGGAFTFRTDGTAANSTTGLNGFLVYDVPIGGGPGALLGQSVSDDLMWQPNGQIDKAVPGVPTPVANGLRAVVVSVRGYSDAPEFLFDNMAGAGGQSLAQLFGKYKSGGFSTPPATLDLAVDVGSGTGFVLPVFLRS